MANEIFQRESIIVEKQLAIGRDHDDVRLGELDVVSVDDTVVSIIAGSSSSSIINFGDNVSNAGSFEFLHTDNLFRLKIAGIDKLTISNTEVIIAGNLTVNGTTTTVNSSNLAITDNIIVVNSGEVGAGVTLGTAGIEIDRGSSSNAQWLWIESTDTWEPAGVTAVIANSTFITSGTVTLNNIPPTANNHLTRKDYVDGQIASVIAGTVPAGIDDRIVRYNGTNSLQSSSVELNDTGQVLGIAGLAATPSFSFIGDPNTGMFNSSANVLGFSAGGASQLTISISTIDAQGNTLTNIADPTDPSHIGDRGFNDIRYVLSSTHNEVVEDIVGQMVIGNVEAGIVVSYDDGIGKLNFDVMDFTITLGGDLTGNVTITNLNNATLTAAIVNDSHTHDTSYFTEAESDTRFLRRDATSLPTATTTFDLGSSSFKWNNIFATTFNGTATSAQYADLAERYAADMNLDPGTVVVFGGEAEITESYIAFNTTVAGIISENPAYMMNSEAGTNQTHPYVALKGKVPCKVIGPIKKGDLIVTSKLHGFGRSAGKKAPAYTAFARAVEDFDGDRGMILVSVI